MWLFKFKLFFKYPISPWCRASWICRINELYTFSKILILYSGPSAIHLCYLTIATKFQFNCIWNEKNGLPVWTRVWVRLRLVRAGLVGQALSYSTKIRFYLARSGYLVCVCVWPWPHIASNNWIRNISCREVMRSAVSWLIIIELFLWWTVNTHRYLCIYFFLKHLSRWKQQGSCFD